MTGQSNEGAGVVGVSISGRGVSGRSKSNAGVVGESDEFDGVWGTTHHPDRAAVTGVHHGALAGFFDGKVHVTEDLLVTGDIQLAGADLAEDFVVGTSVPLGATGRALSSRWTTTARCDHRAAPMTLEHWGSCPA